MEKRDEMKIAETFAVNVLLFILISFADMEDFTRVVLSYEIYERGLNEMTTRVRICSTSDPLKRGFIAFKINVYSIRKRC